MSNKFQVGLKWNPSERNESRFRNKDLFIYITYFYVYILKCSDDSYYTGVTNNLKRRLEEHDSGAKEESYTYSRRPFELVYFEPFKYILNAIAREKQIKNWSRKKKEALMKKEFKELHELAKCRNDSSYFKWYLENLG